MQLDTGQKPFIALLRACAKNKDLQRGSQIHADIQKLGLLDKDVFMGSALVNMYAKCGSLINAQEVFDALLTRNVVSWNSLIAGYAQQEHGQQTLHSFEWMQMEGLSPDAITFACVLKACGSLGNIKDGKQIEAWVVREGLLERHLIVGNALVDMYVKFAMLPEAQEAFDKLRIRNVVSWNVLIAGYVKHGHFDKALDCFQRMKVDGTCLDSVTLVSVLKACASVGAIDKGKAIHDEIAREGWLEKNAFISSALVIMYAKCGCLAKAQKVFDKLPNQSIGTWNALISGYMQHGHCEEALNCFDQMRSKDFTPNIVSFICVLKACGSIGAACKGKEIHSEIMRERLFKRNIVLGNSLIDMYMKCGMLTSAQEVFEDIQDRDLTSWNGLISGYIQHGHCEEALHLLDCLQLEGLCPDGVTYASCLQACASIAAVNVGQEIHYLILKEDLLVMDTSLGTALVDMYGKCRLFTRACEVLDGLLMRDMISWSALIIGYAQDKQWDQALNCFKQMQYEGIYPDAVSIVSVLKACGCTGYTGKGQNIHAGIVREGLFERNDDISSALIDMYFKCGLDIDAQQVFNQLPVQTTASWNSLVAGYAELGCIEEAFSFFEEMQCRGHVVCSSTFIHVLQAFSSTGEIYKCQEIHAEILRGQLLEKDVVVGNALVDMYAKSGFLAKAQIVFEGLQFLDVASWNVLIGGYAHYDRVLEALNCFERMQLKGFCPNAITFSSILKACGNARAIDMGKVLHADIVKEGFMGTNIIVSNAVLDMYCRCGFLMEALEVFTTLCVRDVVTWNVLIAGYIQNGHDEEALNCFDKMELEFVTPNEATLVCALKACGSLSAAHRGNTLHDKIVTEGLMENYRDIGNALVDMYGKCGLIMKAQEVFDNLGDKDVVTWNALLTGYSLTGDTESLFHLLDLMESSSVKADFITFVSVLNACSHTGQLAKGQTYFESMYKNYGVRPIAKHYNCMIDMFARAGNLCKAAALIKEMPLLINLSIWHTVWSACRQAGALELEGLAFEYAVQLDEDSTSYCGMSRIYEN